MSREYLLTGKSKQGGYRFLLLSFLSLSVLWYFFSGVQAFAGQASLSWEAPSSNDDGTPLTDLNGYKIYYGTAPGNYTQNIDVGNVTTYTFTDLTDGQTYYFVATAYNTARIESGYSNEVSKIIPSSPQTYTLTVNKAGTGSGIISSSPAGITCGGDCTETYNAGAAITLTATPDTSSTFTGWSGACGSTGSCSVTMDAAKSVTATFALKTSAITATAGTGGSISPSGTVLANYGSSQLFTITASAGYSIANVLVDGASVGAVASYTFSNITATHTISANFAPVTYGLTVSKAGTGSGIISSSPAGITCGGDCTETYNAGAAITLTATPDTSSTFTGWSGACGSTGSCSVTMDAAKSVTATFALKTSAITATAGTGGSISPSGTVLANYGSSQLFTITASAGYSIANVLVDGASVGAVASYTFSNITATHTISANFAPVTYGLTVSKAGTGSGIISSSPAGITCGGDCTETYNAGAAITLTATPDTSSTFTGWSGACGSTGSCSVTMDAAKSVTATFALKTSAITATAGTGGSISPSGTVLANYGSSQLFTITASAGYSIANVLVDGASVGAVASYTFSNITATHTISANFAPVTYGLTVSKAGTGSGIISSSPAGITCGGDCTETYNAGAAITLTATPDTSSTFTGWSGACGSTGSCSVTMDAAKSVTATFALKTSAITATAGTGRKHLTKWDCKFEFW